MKVFLTASVDWRFCGRVDTDVKYVYAARCRAEGGPARASAGAPLPAHRLTGALIPAKTLSRRHFVYKVRSARTHTP